MNEAEGKILIVEDEILIGLMLARKLQLHGYEVGAVVTTGEEALARVDEQKPIVVLMDVSLAGELNGLETARIIKERHDIPIIIFSGYDDKWFLDQTREIGPVAVLKKLGPFSDLLSALDRVVS